jgi:hypothetical protein
MCVVYYFTFLLIWVHYSWLSRNHNLAISWPCVSISWPCHKIICRGHAFVTWARNTLSFLFTYLFSITFLYYFIFFFLLFNLVVSIFIQSYVNSILHGPCHKIICRGHAFVSRDHELNKNSRIFFPCFRKIQL